MFAHLLKTLMEQELLDLENPLRKEGVSSEAWQVMKYTRASGAEAQRVADIIRKGLISNSIQTTRIVL